MYQSQPLILLHTGSTHIALLFYDEGATPSGTTPSV